MPKHTLMFQTRHADGAEEDNLLLKLFFICNHSEHVAYRKMSMTTDYILIYFVH